MLIAILMHLKDDDPFGQVKQLTDALAPGSYLALTHLTKDFMPPDRHTGLYAAVGRKR